MESLLQQKTCIENFCSEQKLSWKKVPQTGDNIIVVFKRIEIYFFGALYAAAEENMKHLLLANNKLQVLWPEMIEHVADLLKDVSQACYAEMMNLKKQGPEEIQRNRSVFDFAFFSLTHWITKKLKINLDLYEVQQMESADVNLHMAYVSK
jgi:hypothetical protein